MHEHVQQEQGSAEGKNDEQWRIRANKRRLLTKGKKSNSEEVRSAVL